ncbi:MAG: hypothetical protein IJT81_01755 [Lachnospiraceae bacterium]|nr:hypothetical protein [Lachnospiraceae bacterium]MBQ9579781.1 hypothetical protein [Lachnospiraceae bacterium]
MQGAVRKRREKAKFSGRTHSTRGIISFILGVISLSAFLGLINYAFVLKGQASKYVGSIGIFAFMITCAGLMLGIKGLREEDVYKMAPLIGLILNILSVLILTAVFVWGMLL